MFNFSDHMVIAFLFAMSICIFVIIINVLLFYVLIRTAIRKIVKPEFESRGLTYIDYKWTGFWGCGDFKDKIEFALFKTGLNTTSVYFFIYYKKADFDKRVTAKIDFVNLKIDKIFYSHEF